MVFRWLRGSEDGLVEVERLFTGMLVDGRRVFDLAFGARLGEYPADTIAEDLAATEERTDESEREIRRRVIVHASLHGTEELTACLMYMSIGKDAERIADLARNIFGIAQEVEPPPPGALHDDLADLRTRVSPRITRAGEVLLDEDVGGAEELITEARELQERCRVRIGELLREESAAPQPVASALTYRHTGRIMANVLNIASAVVMPLDQLDYPRPTDDP